jgi:hypothetical protein
MWVIKVLLNHDLPDARFDPPADLINWFIECRLRRYRPKDLLIGKTRRVVPPVRKNRPQDGVIVQPRRSRRKGRSLAQTSYGFPQPLALGWCRHAHGFAGFGYRGSRKANLGSHLAYRLGADQIVEVGPAQTTFRSTLSHLGIPGFWFGSTSH